MSKTTFSGMQETLQKLSNNKTRNRSKQLKFLCQTYPEDEKGRQRESGEFPTKCKWKTNIQLKKRSLIDLNLFFSKSFFSSGSITKVFLPPNRVVTNLHNCFLLFMLFTSPLWPSKESTFKQVIIIIHLRLAFSIFHLPSQQPPSFRHVVSIPLRIINIMVTFSTILPFLTQTVCSTVSRTFIAPITIRIFSSLLFTTC